MAGKSTREHIVSGAAQQFVTAPVLARWLGIPGKTAYELAKAGILIRISRDQFLLEESVRRYCDHIRKTASRYDGESGSGAIPDPSGSSAAEVSRA